MQTYTQTFHDAIASTDREIRGYIKFNNTFTLRGEDGLISFKCTQNAMDNERFCVGSVTSAMCEASFFNYGMEGSGVSLANSYFDAYVGVVTDADNNTVEYVCMGRFYIAEITRSAQTTRILGYDIAGRLSMDYVPNVAADPDNGYLVMDVLNDIIDQTGVNGGDPFTQYGDSTYVPQLYEGNCRSQWGWLCTMVDQTAAEYSGTRDPADLGYMRSYVIGNGASPYAIDDSTIYMDGLSIGDRFVITSYTTGTSDNPIVVGNGSGAVGLNPYMTQSAAEAVELTIDGFAYYPITLRWRGDPCLDIMDKLSITQGQDTYTAVVMKIETTFNGGLEQRVTCWGDSEDYYALSTSPTEAQIKTVSNLVHEIQQSIETAEGGVITKILDTDGTWKELVIANNQDLDQATSVWRFNINGLAHSNRYQGGTYTLAMDTQGRIVANVIQTGILQDAAGNNSWNLDTGALTITDGSINIETNSSTDDRIILNYTSGADEYSANVSPSGVSVSTTDGTNYYVSALTPYTSVHSIYNDTEPTLGTLQGTASYGWGVANLETATDKVSIDSTGVILSAQTNWANPIPQAELRQYGLMFYGSNNTLRAQLLPTEVTLNNASGTQQIKLDGANGRIYPLGSSNYINDFVIAQGTSGGWRYRKWNSKFYECWYTIAPATRSFSAWGTVFASSSISAITYPTTFASVPWEFAVPHGGTNSVWLDRSGTNTTTKSATYEGIKPTSGSANFGLILYVAGVSST